MISLRPSQALDQIAFHMKHNSTLMKPERWQAFDVSETGAKMCEILHTQFAMKLIHGTNIAQWVEDLCPNYPWAEDHFRERVCGVALNPGKEWENWPWATKADESREPNGQFNHNYMERFWPKFANLYPTKTEADFDRVLTEHEPNEMWGIRGEYGDLGDMIHHLAVEPTTRQAYLPIWFPEDTAYSNNGRKPCTLGYHFIMRNGVMDITYHIRSCDYYRHFADDVYMAVRLAIHVLQSCRAINPEAWRHVEMGNLVMNITSLHMFLPDYQLVFRQKHPQE